MRSIVRAMLLTVGAPLLLCSAALRAQEPQPQTPPDTVAVDTLPPTARVAAVDSARGDTLMAPIPTGEIPRLPAIGPEYRWRGDEIFATGALTLLDLLQQLPEVSGLRSGWLLPPEYATVAGSLGRIRLILDGVEIDAIDPRQGGLHDLGTVQLWSLEEIAVERGVDELRVHMRSWRAEQVNPVTRVDVATGDYNTNLYRGFFGRRFGRGEVLQLGGQQYSTRDPSFGGDGDRLSLVARLGVARPRWSVDGWVQRTSGFRGTLTRLQEMTPLAPLEATSTLAYARAAWRAPEEVGVWAQAMASTQSVDEQTETSAGGAEDGADTTRSRAQYVGVLGWSGSSLSLSATGRLRVYEGEQFFTPSVRAGYSASRLELSAFAERRGEDELTRIDATARLTPVPFLAVSGGVASERREDGETRFAVRGEGGVRLGSLWAIGGVIVSETQRIPAPVALDPDFMDGMTGEAGGVYAGLRGPLWRNFTVDVVGTRWNKTGGVQVYRPEFDVSGRVEYFNQWLSKFPRGNFHVRAALFGSYTSNVVFPTSIGDTPVALETVSGPGLNSLLEIRISDAVIMVQYRNALGVDYETVPGYLMPQPAIIYGVRWSFRN